MRSSATLFLLREAHQFLNMPPCEQAEKRAV
jgi:hypothetical protein